MSLDQRFQFADQVAVAPERQLRLHSILKGNNAEVLQARRLRLGKRLVGDIGQSRASLSASCSSDAASAGSDFRSSCPRMAAVRNG
jgi:hypothetical protein